MNSLNLKENMYGHLHICLFFGLKLDPISVNVSSFEAALITL